MNKKSTKQGSTNASSQSSLIIFHWESRCIKDATPTCKTHQYLRRDILFVQYIIGFFIELYLVIQQKRRRPDAATYSWRITNDVFYRPVKIKLCIWRVGDIIFLQIGKGIVGRGKGLTKVPNINKLGDLN